MTISFTEIAVILILVFGIAGYLRGAKSFGILIGAIFFSIVLVSFAGDSFLTVVNRLGFHLVSVAAQSLFFAVLFLLSIIVVQVGVGRLIPGLKRSASLNRDSRLWGLILGFVNGFLIVSVTAHYAGPYLSTLSPAQDGGWRVSIPSVHFSHPTSSSYTMTLENTVVTITPSPLMQLYDHLPVALILLFVFLLIVFLGTVYNRFSRSHA